MGGGKRGKEKGPPGRFSRQLEGRGEECQGEYRKRINNCLAAPCVCTERKAFVSQMYPFYKHIGECVALSGLRPSSRQGKLRRVPPPLPSSLSLIPNSAGDPSCRPTYYTRGREEGGVGETMTTHYSFPTLHSRFLSSPGPAVAFHSHQT